MNTHLKYTHVEITELRGTPCNSYQSSISDLVAATYVQIMKGTALGYSNKGPIPHPSNLTKQLKLMVMTMMIGMLRKALFDTNLL